MGVMLTSGIGRINTPIATSSNVEANLLYMLGLSPCCSFSSLWRDSLRSEGPGGGIAMCVIIRSRKTKFFDVTLDVGRTFFEGFNTCHANTPFRVIPLRRSKEGPDCRKKLAELKDKMKGDRSSLKEEMRKRGGGRIAIADGTNSPPTLGSWTAKSAVSFL